jgi:DNA/RNA endonuclease G (NUC1)
MKKLLLILLLPLSCFGQTVKYPGYTAYWNATTKIPDSVIWVAKPHVKVANRAAGFHATDGRLNETSDYVHSGYDIGHNCPASDENGNATDEYNSFDFVNTYPQKPNCNRLTWLALENQVRVLAAKYGQVRNKVYWRGVSGYIGKDRVTAPALCIKEIWYNSKHEKYVMPNSDTCNRHLYTYYLVK